MPRVQSKRFCFTWNNYTEETHASLKTFATEQCGYLIYGKEKAPETGTLHLQGYFELKTKKALSTLKKLLGDSPHFEVAKGSAADNKEYCGKDGDLFEWGTPMKQGKRSDIETVREIVAAAPPQTMLQVINSGVGYQAIRYAEKVLTFTERKRDWIPTVLWFYGATGRGKSQTAKALAKLLHTEPFWKFCEKGSNWWEGYDAESYVIIDDLRAEWMPYNVLLTLLDSNPFRVPYKGGYRQLLATTMVVTCPHAPWLLKWPDEKDTDNTQLVRRIKLSYEFDGHKTPQQYAWEIYEEYFQTEEEKTCPSDTAETHSEEDSGEETPNEELAEKTRFFRQWQQENREEFERNNDPFNKKQKET